MFHRFLLYSWNKNQEWMFLRIYVSRSGTDPAVGGPCPDAHFCPSGTSSPFPCEAGTYNKLKQQATCFTCPAGYFCRDNETTYEDFPCPIGHFCPPGTKSSNQNPCPVGTYRADTGGQRVEDCLSCTCAKSCSNIELNASSEVCTEG